MADHHQHSHSDDHMAEMLDLDGEVLAETFLALTDWIAEHLADHPATRILDLGAGTGTGTFALLNRFSTAQVTAVDASPDMLHHLTARAAGSGLDDRVKPLQVNLDEAALPPGPYDVAWASASMHHLNDPERTLAELRSGLAPGGVFAMIEFETFPRFLPHDIGIGRPGLEDRLNQHADAQRVAHHPTVNSDWTARLVSCGFKVLQERTFDLDLPSPLSPTAVQYARITLSRLREGMGDLLSAEDRSTLEALLDSSGPTRLEERDDLTVRSSRRAWIAVPA